MGLINFDGSGTPFNMAMIYYMSLNKLWDAKDEAYLNGDIFTWFLGLNAMFRKISFKIEKEEKKEIKNQLKKIRNDLKDFPPIIKTAEQKREFINSEVAEKLAEIDIKLVNILNKNNMIFPKIDTTVGLDKVRKRYGLDG